MSTKLVIWTHKFMKIVCMLWNREHVCNFILWFTFFVFINPYIGSFLHFHCRICFKNSKERTEFFCQNFYIYTKTVFHFILWCTFTLQHKINWPHIIDIQHRRRSINSLICNYSSIWFIYKFVICCVIWSSSWLRGNTIHTYIRIHEYIMSYIIFN